MPNNDPRILITPLKPALILGVAQKLPVLVRVQAPDDAPAAKKERRHPVFTLEDKDWAVEAPSRPKGPPYHAPKPVSIPGARVIKTIELKGLFDANQNVAVID